MTVKTVDALPARRIVAVVLPGTRPPACAVFLELPGDCATAYQELPEPARA